MKSRRGRMVVSVLTVLTMLLVSGPGSSRLLMAAEGETGAAVKYVRYLEVKPGELRGQVLYPDGKTPAAKVSVRVWSVEQKKFVHETVTDEKGNYTLPRLAAGRYLVVFGDRVSVDLRVVETASMVGKPLNVIIPHGQVFFSPEEMQAELAGEGEGGGKLLRTLLIVGAAGATAVGIVALAGAGGGGGGRKVVSP